MKLSSSFIKFALCALQLSLAAPMEEIVNANTSVAEIGSERTQLHTRATERCRPYDDGDDDLCEVAIKSAVPVYQTWNTYRKDSFYTADPAEFDSMLNQQRYARYKALVPWKVLRKQLPGSKPIYRLWNGNPAILDHLYTNSDEERAQAEKDGYVFQNILGYSFDEQKCGTSPLYKMWLSYFVTTKAYSRRSVYRRRQSYQDHIYTIEDKERDWLNKTWQYQMEGNIGFVFAPTARPKD